MKIENVNEPTYRITINEKERQALEDIFGNMAEVHLIKLLGDNKLSHFVIDFYKLVTWQNEI